MIPESDLATWERLNKDFAEWRGPVDSQAWVTTEDIARLIAGYRELAEETVELAAQRDMWKAAAETEHSLGNEARAEVARLTAAIRAEVEGCQRCKGAGEYEVFREVEKWGLAVTESLGMRPCQACRRLREALEAKG